MGITALFRHAIAIERATGTGELDEYNHEIRRYDAIATMPGLVQSKRATEVEALSQAGAVVGEHTIYLAPTDVIEADRIRFEPDDGQRFEITGIRPFTGYGANDHLEIDARRVLAAVTA